MKGYPRDTISPTCAHATSTSVVLSKTVTELKPAMGDPEKRLSTPESNEYALEVDHIDAKCA
jgi:hypothetical protein